MIQCFLAERSVQALDVRGGLGGAVRDRDTLDAHDIHQPHAEVASVVETLLPTTPAVTVLTENAIFVAVAEAERRWRAAAAGPGSRGRASRAR